jgi:hypothetical protein
MAAESLKNYEAKLTFIASNRSNRLEHGSLIIVILIRANSQGSRIV